MSAAEDFVATEAPPAAEMFVVRTASGRELFEHVDFITAKRWLDRSPHGYRVTRRSDGAEMCARKPLSRGTVFAMRRLAKDLGYDDAPRERRR